MSPLSAPYAVINTGGHQYRVAANDVIAVEKCDADPGKTLKITDVLLLGGDGKPPRTGTPTLKGASVDAKILEHVKSPTITVFKKKRRKGYRRKNGHRQTLTRLQITAIHPESA